MHNLQATLIVVMFLLIGWLTLLVSLRVAQIFMKRELSISRIFYGLKPKLFMTAALGGFFISLYIAVVYFGAYLLSGEVRQTLFNYVRTYPIYFVYGGLVLFVSVSLTILIVRSFIKRFYNSR